MDLTKKPEESWREWHERLVAYFLAQKKSKGPKYPVSKKLLRREYKEKLKKQKEKQKQ